MRGLAASSAALLLAATAAFAQQQSSPGHAEMMSAVPNNSVTITDWYKQTSAIRRKQNRRNYGRFGQARRSRQRSNVGVAGSWEKDVAVPFAAVKHTMKDRKVYLTMDTDQGRAQGRARLQI
jgi:hypothetical protein